MSLMSPPHPRRRTPARRTPKLLVSLLVIVGAVTALSGVAAGAEQTDTTRTVNGPTGQTLTVTPADGLALTGASVKVTGTGYDPTIGVYLALCVDNGVGVSPGPCVGGASMAGGAGASFWISSNPPSYAVGLTTPFTAEGAFDLTLSLSSGDEFVDCFDPQVRCVVATRADHTNPGVHSADVTVPVSFVGQAPIVDDPPVDPPVDDTDDTVVPPAPDEETPANPIAMAVPTTIVPAPVVETGTLTSAVPVTTDPSNPPAAKALAFTGSSSWWLTAMALALMASGWVLTRIARPAAVTQLYAQTKGRSR
ncbi:MAG: hypothetical protein WBF71_14160 [Microthrixaceae bacterium]